MVGGIVRTGAISAANRVPDTVAYRVANMRYLSILLLSCFHDGGVVSVSLSREIF